MSASSCSGTCCAMRRRTITRFAISRPRFSLPIIASNGVRFADVPDRPLYDVLTCIRHKTTLAHAGRRLSWNAERYLKSPEAMARLFVDLPDAIAGTRELADRLEYSMTDLGYRFPEYPVPPGETMASFLRKMTQAGASERYRPYHDRARAQISRELNLIEKLDLAGYFLIVWDIVNFCRQEDILVQGRGSAANSAVCYSLGITAVDPVGMDLLFERFLSEERGEWPDIDLDLPSGDRRERVIQHVYQKYGKHGAAMTANVITYRGRSAAREVGKTLSLDADEIDRLAKVMNRFEWVDPQETIDRNLRDAGIDGSHPGTRRFVELWLRIQDLPRHLGQHSGGMVICQGRLDDVVPLENASMPDRVVVQWDKDDCADMRLVKVDLLGLGMMAVLQDALTLVNGRTRGSGLGTRGSGLEARRVREPRAPASNPEPPEPRVPSEPDRRPRASSADDPDVYRMLQEADTIGVFQVESRAQMATLPRLRPAKLLRHRRRSRHHPPRADRRQHGASVSEAAAGAGDGRLSASLARADPRAHAGRAAVSGAAAAHGDGGGGLYGRRGRGTATGDGLQAIREAHAADRRQAARRAWRGRASPVPRPRRSSDRSPRSRSMAFPSRMPRALRCSCMPAPTSRRTTRRRFITALLNNQPMGFYHPATLVKDAQRHGVRFAPIDVQVSDWECRVEPDGRVRLGLMYVNGLRSGSRAGDCRGRARDGRAEGKRDARGRLRCPKCGCDDRSMLEDTPKATRFCNICAHEWDQHASRARFAA